ncbi:hypothetical protein GINT2_002208 [Glugoides intestinalis]
MHIATAKSNPFSESLGVCHILYSLKFFLVLFLNFLYRRAETECDAHVINNGFKRKLIEYVRKLSYKTKTTGSPAQYGILKAFSPNNCFRDRLETIERLAE